ncbi:hypothetical protein BDQ17DRAFT_1545090 [Cyathus striatus]|nr:hypothetical protein BDQ17DRAFT_1545090 [Cyathus striatus]
MAIQVARGRDGDAVKATRVHVVVVQVGIHFCAVPALSPAYISFIVETSLILTNSNFLLMPTLPPYRYRVSTSSSPSEPNGNPTTPAAFYFMEAVGSVDFKLDKA